ncbi:MAG: histidine--tRNA ligase [Methanocorpusculum sp.]|uniref:Histidine--tRNA ligase n=1 Tax=Methanocorpusculum petauri TaxID=3002863 RepID=A0ABT4IDS2_9EURY|nr:histidine--tRNA ligase [Methanocorpusculum petauri]MCZ0859726.1 histidine--tRNA ligase [Methanocorpusculum petauri]MDE2444378.1 histidine--tRNA ligase [Methanocorpusculum sp.]MDE2523230.1 histidine--tRNA ligase [Methanocorpusculum sp.]MDE2523964.1 histidine--tRNA ligase [Methanocorpusculum sp.]
MLQKPRGTRDFLPAEMAQRRYIERRMRDVARSFGYGEVQTPMFEEQELFTLKSGEGIIGEMYAFEDKGGRKIALRPELTAAVVRAYVNEAQVAPKPLRWFYFAECFRYERPQKGRYRQFWQFGCELIGADSPAADAEVIALAYELLKSSGVRFVLKIGHLAPMKHLLAGLDATGQKKVMAALDKRDTDLLHTTLAAIGHADLYEPLIRLITAATLDEVWAVTGDIPEKERIEETFRYLTAQNIPFVQNFGIARGLDYYTGMVFEGFADNLGAENQILGGGVYRLAHLFGGKDVPSCGFAIGFDRVMVSLGEIVPETAPVVAVVATPQTRTAAYAAAAAFRAAGITVVMDVMDRSFGAQLSSALKSGASYAVLIGEKEAAAGTVTLKNLAEAAQTEMSLADAVDEVANGSC